MDFVYLCKNGENEELRYSIRSVLNSFPDASIWVVGGRPSWYRGKYIEVPQKNTKYGNARKNLIAIINSNEISEDFVLMNDDFFIVDKIDEIKTYRSWPLINRLESNRSRSVTSVYTQMLSRTYEELWAMGHKDPVDYELHVPMPMNKHMLRDVLKYRGTLWRSMYGNMFDIDGEVVGDVKIYPAKMNRPSYVIGSTSLPYISTEDESFNEVLNNFLAHMFKEKSNNEK